ncbi:MAG: class I SAM-dependent methyltransferase, partial [Saprospiraceae bacterium]
VAEAHRLNAEFVQAGRAQFVLADVGKMPFADGSFHKIFTVNTLYFWENPAAVLTELKRVLRQDGQLLLSFRPKIIMAQYPMTKYGFTMYSKEEAVKLFTDNGLEVTAAFEIIEPTTERWGGKLERESVIVMTRKN